jgi:hypothetical protein
MRVRHLVVPAVLLFTGLGAACAPLDQVVRQDSRNSVLYGEVRSLDTRRGRVQLREDRGRDVTVRYDGRTRVHYGSRQYPVTSLQRGDVVQVRLAYDRNGNAWADRIDVRNSVGDRRVATARVVRLDGRVRGVDPSRRFFTVEADRGRPVMVLVSRRLDRDDARRIERLRRGDRVRADVRPLRGDEVELVRFR